MGKFQGTHFIPDGSSGDDMDVLHRQTEAGADHLKDLELALNPTTPDNSKTEFDADLKKVEGLTDFSSIPKPTEIIPAEEPAGSVVLQKDPTPIPAPEAIAEKFKVPSSLLKYLTELKKTKVGISWFEHTIATAISTKEILDGIQVGLKKNTITEEEAERMKSFLSSDASEGESEIDSATLPVQPEEIVSGDEEYAKEAIVAYRKGDIEECVNSLKKIADGKTQFNIVSGIIKSSINKKEFGLARTLAEVCVDKDSRDSLISEIDNSEAADYAASLAPKETPKPEVLDEETPKEEVLKDEVENAGVQKLVDALASSPDKFMDLAVEYAEGGKGREFWSLIEDVKDDAVHDQMITALIIDSISNGSIAHSRNTADKIRIPAVKDKINQMLVTFENNALKKHDLLKELNDIDFQKVIENPNDSKADDYIDDAEFDNFDETGEISDSVLEQIADRIAKGETIVDREIAIYNKKSAEIDAIVAQKEAEMESDTVDTPDTAPDTDPDDTLPIVDPLPTVDDTTSTDSLGVPDAVVPTTEAMEAINAELESARSAYAEQMVLWKNGVRAKKRFWQKVKSEIGFEKPIPEHEKPDPLQEAEKAYIEAKKKKREQMFTDKVALIADVEAEVNALQKRVLENIPPLEKGIVAKGLEKWSKLGHAKRIAISTILLGVGAIVFTGAAVGAVAGSAGVRAVRAVAGAAAAEATGTVVQKISERRNQKRKDATLDEYTANIDIGNFEEREKKLMEAFENADTVEKRQRLYKALAMAAAGGGVTLGAYLGDSAPDVLGQVAPETEVPIIERPKSGFIQNPIPGTDVQDYLDKVAQDTGGEVPVIEKPQSSFIKNPIPGTEVQDYLDKMTDAQKADLLATGKTAGVETGGTTGAMPTETGPGAPEAVDAPAEAGTTEVVDTEKDMRVEASSKGFMQDVHNIKAEILGHYGTLENVPEALRENFWDKPPIKVAEDFGFFDKQTGFSGKTMAGDHLFIDDKGNIVFEHKGVNQVLFDIEKEQINKFNGEMFKPGVSEATATAPTPETVLPEDQTLQRARDNFMEKDVKFPIGDEAVPTVDDRLSNNFREGADFSKVPPPLETVVVPDQPEIIGADKVVPEAPVTLEGIPMYGETPIASYQEVGGRKMLVLDDKFQDGEQYKQVRQQFAEIYEKQFDSTSSDGIVTKGPLGTAPFGGEFEGGMVDIVRNDIGATQVLLNGKEIGKGYVIDGKSSVKIDPNLKGGFFFADTVYERAFKRAKDLIDAGIKTNQLGIKK